MRIKESEAISKWETFCVVINLMTYKLFTLIPALFSKDSGQAAFISAVFTGIVALVIVWFMLFLYRRYGGINILETAENAFGKSAKYILAVILVLYLITAACFALSEFSELVSTMAFPTSPMWFTGIFFILAVIIANIRGHQGILRTHLVTVPICAFLTVVLLSSVFLDADFSNLFPVMGLGAENVFIKALRGIVMYTDIILLFMLNPYCADQKHLKKAAFGAAIFSVVLCSIFVLIYSAVVPYPASADGEIPVYMIMKSIYYGRFFQRADAIYMLFAILSGMLYLSFTVSLIPITLKSAFGGTLCRAYGVIFGLTVFLLVQTKSVFSFARDVKGIYIAGGAVFVLVMGILLVCAIKGRKQNEVM